jgi:hypothetical protein
MFIIFKSISNFCSGGHLWILLCFFENHVIAQTALSPAKHFLICMRPETLKAIQFARPIKRHKLIHLFQQVQLCGICNIFICAKLLRNDLLEIGCLRTLQ